MKYGFVIPRGDINSILDLAVQGELAGWDGVFYWDGIYIEEVPLMYDAWTVLAAMALKTKRIRIGAMLTAVNRRRPWKLARESTTVDHLSNGRLIIPVGLGALDDGGYSKVGEPTDRKTRAELLDEGLDILTGLWTGKPFSYAGKHFKIGEMTFRPTPIQKPRIPVWVVGAWPSKRSIRRALRYDGLIPAKISSPGTFAKLSLDELRDVTRFVKENRSIEGHFDIVWEGETPLGDPAKSVEIVKQWEKAGATWWIESRWTRPDEMLARVKQGPLGPI